MRTDTADGRSAILIAGPTASGKSALAMRLARRLGGIVVNADSMQVYADLRVLTARPSLLDERDVPHLLYGTVDGATCHSVNLWLDDVTLALDRVRERAMVPIIVGGTGLYFKALTEGLSDIPPIPEAVRAGIRLWAKARPPGALHAELAKRDPDTAARLRPTDPQRLVRALEVFEATGRGLASFQAERDPPLLDPRRCLSLALAVDRCRLRDTVDQRFDRMIADGALEEVEALAARDLPDDVPIMRALGVQPLLRHLRGAMELGEAVREAKLASRRYLKRQDTFLRTQLGTFVKVAPEQAEAFAIAAVGPAGHE